MAVRVLNFSSSFPLPPSHPRIFHTLTIFFHEDYNVKGIYVHSKALIIYVMDKNTHILFSMQRLSLVHVKNYKNYLL